MVRRRPLGAQPLAHTPHQPPRPLAPDPPFPRRLHPSPGLLLVRPPARSRLRRHLRRDRRRARFDVGPRSRAHARREARGLHAQPRVLRAQERARVRRRRELDPRDEGAGRAGLAQQAARERRRGQGYDRRAARRAVEAGGGRGERAAQGGERRRRREGAGALASLFLSLHLSSPSAPLSFARLTLDLSCARSSATAPSRPTASPSSACSHPRTRPSTSRRPRVPGASRSRLGQARSSRSCCSDSRRAQTSRRCRRGGSTRRPSCSSRRSCLPIGE